MNEIIFYDAVEGVRVLNWDVVYPGVVLLHNIKAIAFSHSQYPNKMLEEQNNF